jgi:hypothetical protein
VRSPTAWCPSKDQAGNSHAGTIEIAPDSHRNARVFASTNDCSFASAGPSAKPQHETLLRVREFSPATSLEYREVLDTEEARLRKVYFPQGRHRLSRQSYVGPEASNVEGTVYERDCALSAQKDDACALTQPERFEGAENALYGLATAIESFRISQDVRGKDTGRGGFATDCMASDRGEYAYGFG